MIDEINEVREWVGAPALRYSPSLSQSSARYARQLVRTRRFRHAARIRASSRFAKLGEILALDPSGQIDRMGMILKWLASPSHRAVLLSPSFRYVGAGRAGGRRAKNTPMVWTVQFGTRRMR